MTNNIPNQPPNRIDQIEAILLQVAIQQQATAAAQEANATAIGNLTGRIDQLTIKVDGLATQMAALGTELENVTDILMHSINNAESDREAWQAEIKRIWEYLLGQSQNGHTS
jgi:hypothetical protein